MREKIYVVSHGANWRVRCEHCAMFPVGTQTEAIRQARAHVASLPQGTLSQILVQRDSGEFRTEWTYGKDPFPPRG